MFGGIIQKEDFTKWSILWLAMVKIALSKIVEYVKFHREASPLYFSLYNFEVDNHRDNLEFKLMKCIWIVWNAVLIECLFSEFDFLLYIFLMNAIEKIIVFCFVISLLQQSFERLNFIQR